MWEMWLTLKQFKTNANLSVLASFKKRQGAWKILRGNLKILGFLPQTFIKTMFTKNDRALQENDRALHPVVLA